MWQEQLPLRDLVHHKLKQIETGNPLLDLRNKFVLGLQYIAETPRQRALMQILYHKCEFNSDMMSECEIRKKIGFGYDSVRNILQGCVRNQILPKDTNIEIILIVLYSAFSGLIKNWLMDPQQFDLYQQAPLLVDNIMSTVCAQSLWRADLLWWLISNSARFRSGMAEKISSHHSPTVFHTRYLSSYLLLTVIIMRCLWTLFPARLGIFR